MRAAGNPERAVQEKRYLKSPFKFHGVSVPSADRIARDFMKKNKGSNKERIIAIVLSLWKSDYHDEKRLALKLLRHYPAFITPLLMPMFENMLLDCTGWDLVDEIAIHLVGSVLENDKRSYSYLKRWSRSENFWMRRASLISQILLFRKGLGDRKLFYSLAEGMVIDKEFFIRKAIGWVIREISRSDPEAAFAFLMKIRDRASRLTVREGAKRLPERMRKQVLALSA